MSIIFSVPSFPANQKPETSLGFGTDSLRFHIEISVEGLIFKGLGFFACFRILGLHV